MESVGLLDPANLHYSSVVSINSDDARTIHEILLRSIEKVRKNVADSENEDEIFGLNIDFFHV